MNATAAYHMLRSRLAPQHCARLVVGATIMLAASLAAPEGLATEGGASLYLPGFKGPLAGFVPPPGFYFESDVYTYSGELGGVRQLPIGGAVVANVKVDAVAQFLTPTWVTPIEILGGNLGFAATLAYGLPIIDAGLVLRAPRIGRTFTFEARDGDARLGDPIAAAFIGWHSGKLHWALAGAVNIPAGGYVPGELSNLAFNRVIGDVSGAITYLDPENGIEISSSVGFEMNGRNDETRYNSGNGLHADFAASKYLTKDLSIGFLAGAYQQVSDDEGKGARIGPFRGRTVAVGGTIGYNFVAGITPVSTRLKILREVDVENRPQGTIGLLTLSFPLGGQAPAPPTRQQAAVLN